MRGELEGLIQPDGSVVVPAAVADDMLRLLVSGLTAQVRSAHGGGVSPQARRVLYALHKAAQRHEAEHMSDVGTLPPTSSTIEMSVAEAARRMECSTRHVRRLLATGRITGRRLSPRLWLVDEASLDDYRRGNDGQDETRRAG